MATLRFLISGGCYDINTVCALPRAEQLYFASSLFGVSDVTGSA
jgi:hypothetical protein